MANPRLLSIPLQAETSGGRNVQTSGCIDLDRIRHARHHGDGADGRPVSCFARTERTACGDGACRTGKAAAINLAGQGKWRASKLIGVDIYGPDNKKVGDVTEVLFDKTGKIEMVTVGVGGFLGIGAKDVAIPFEQVSWSDEPIVAPPPPPPAGGGAGGGTATAPPPAPPAPRAPAMYPDHGKITMTKDQLTAAPAVTYSGS